MDELVYAGEYLRWGSLVVTADRFVVCCMRTAEPLAVSAGSALRSERALRTAAVLRRCQLCGPDHPAHTSNFVSATAGRRPFRPAVRRTPALSPTANYDPRAHADVHHMLPSCWKGGVLETRLHMIWEVPVQKPRVLLDAAQSDALAGVHDENPPQQVHALFRQSGAARNAVLGRADPLREAMGGHCGAPAGCPSRRMTGLYAVTANVPGRYVCRYLDTPDPRNGYAPTCVASRFLSVSNLPPGCGFSGGHVAATQERHPITVAHQHDVEGDADAPDVGKEAIILPVAENLGRDILGRAHLRMRHRVQDGRLRQLHSPSVSRQLIDASHATFLHTACSVCTCSVPCC